MSKPADGETPIWPTSPTWPVHHLEKRPWRQSVRGGTKDDRMLSEIFVSLPPMISGRDLSLPPQLAVDVEDSLREIASLDATHGANLAALGTILLRTESVASSKIERVEANVTDYARALHGSKANQSATSMAAATVALQELITSAHQGAITKAAVLRSHRELMKDEPGEAAYAGRIRDMQNWIGGSDHSPRNAWYIPPPPELLDSYLDDLMTFLNRDDASSMVQAAVAHAQFESIHPFTDGNGRIGRGLVNAAFRRRGVTTTVVIPLASALVAQRDRYFALLNQYRAGDPYPIVSAFALASRLAAKESKLTAVRMAEFPDRWRESVGSIRSDSAITRILVALPELPIFSAVDLEERVGGATSALYRAIDSLVDAEVVRPLTDRKRNQVWGVSDLLDELEDLNQRIGLAAIAEPKR